MFRTTIKRSVATLGVVAGLLVAAGPASAQVLPGTIGVKAPTKAGTQVGHEGHSAVLIQKHDHQSALVKAPANAMSAGISGEEMSKAVKAPASPSEVFTSVSNVAPLYGDSTTIGVWHEAARNGLVLNTFGGNDTLRGHGITCLDQDLVTVKAPTNSPSCGDTEGTQVGSEGVKAPTNLCTEGNNQPGCVQYIEIQ